MEIINFTKVSDVLAKVPPLTKGISLLDVLEIEGKTVTNTKVRITYSMERFLDRLERDFPEKTKAGFNIKLSVQVRV